MRNAKNHLGASVPFLLLVSATLVWGSLVGCAGESPTEVSSESVQYTVRGVVRDASQLSASPRKVRIEHEAIDDFVGIDGNVDGMMSMSMTMTVVDDASVPEGLSDGEKVLFTLDVDWQRTPTGLVVAVERLAAATELALETASEE